MNESRGSGRAQLVDPSVPELATFLSCILKVLGYGWTCNAERISSKVAKGHDVLGKLTDTSIAYVWGQGSCKLFDGFDNSSFAGIRMTISGFRSCVLVNFLKIEKTLRDMKAIKPKTEGGRLSVEQVRAALLTMEGQKLQELCEAMGDDINQCTAGPNTLLFYPSGWWCMERTLNAHSHGYRRSGFTQADGDTTVLAQINECRPKPSAVVEAVLALLGHLTVWKQSSLCNLVVPLSRHDKVQIANTN